jgi:hypothetical protein
VKGELISPFAYLYIMAEQSRFSKLDKKILVFICEKLIDSDFDAQHPYNDFEESAKILNHILKYFNGGTVQVEDVEFFAILITDNDDVLANFFETKDKSLYDKIEIPVAKTYRLDYTVDGTCTYTEYLSSNFDAYSMNWVASQANQQMNDGNWDYWQGNYRHDTDYENFEMSDSDFGNVYEINDDKSIRESISTIDKLNKKTLLELKNIIEKRLNSL